MRCHAYSFVDRRKCQKPKALQIDCSNSLLSLNFEFFGFRPPKIKKCAFAKMLYKSKNIQKFQKTVTYVVKLTVPNVHAENQGSS